MGLIDRILDLVPTEKRASVTEINEQFKMLNGYTPSFTSFSGGLYEMEMVRSAIHSKAKLMAKLKPEIVGTKYQSLEKTLQFKPNEFQSTYQFLYRVATIIEVNTTCFIVPIRGEDMRTVTGFYPINPNRCELVKDERGELYVRYQFANNQTGAKKLSEVGIIYKHGFKNALWGDGSRALDPTINLLDIQTQGMMEAVKSSASIRFMAKLASTMRSEDISKERERFTKENLSADNRTGLMLFDQKYQDIKQVESKPYVIDDKQMSVIRNNVYSYFGVNDKIIQSSFTEEEYNAFYEAEIETFALQLGQTITNMLFTKKELAYGNEVMFTANRLQYASNKTKMALVNSALDRGYLNVNEAREIFQMKPIDGGDVYRVRLDYAEANKLNEVQGLEPTEGEEDATETE